MDRQKQIELMERADERAAEYFRAWKQDPEVKAALHRYDRDLNPGCGEPPERVRKAR